MPRKTSRHGEVPRPVVLVLITLASVFVGELTIMVVLQHVVVPAGLASALLDATLLTALVTPVLFLSLFRPLSRGLTESHQAAEALRQSHEQLETRVAERTAELVQANEALRAEVTERTRAEESLRWNRDGQLTLNQLLGLAQEDIPLGVLLERSLDVLTSTPWIALEPSAAIFLVETDPRVLVLRASRNLNPDLLRTCARVPFGRCLCGRAAATGRMLHAAGLDETHEIRYEGIGPHGHYCVPLLSQGRVLGVLVLYIRETHVSSDREQRFLEAIADVLASIVRHRRAEHEHRRLTSILDATPDFVSTADPEGHVLYLNEGGRRMIGLEPAEEIRSLRIADVHPGWATRVVMDEGLPAAARTGAWLGETALLTRDGREIPVSQVILVHRAPDGEIEYYSTIMRDISERRRAEEELRKLSTALQQSPALVIITDPAGRIEYVNPRFTQVTGYTLEEVRGKTSRLLESGETPPETYRELWTTITAGGEWTGELLNRKKDGTLYWERALISPVRDATGVITHFLGLNEDITDRKALESQLLHSQKMDLVGQLAGGIAHDFNNLLTVINCCSEMVLSELAPGDPGRGDVELILKSGTKASLLTHQLLAFSRRQVLEPRIMNVNSVVEESEKMFRRLVGENIQVVTTLDPSVGPVKIDPGQLQQVIMNLVVNARDVMPTAGRLTIRTAPAVLDQARASRHPGATPGPAVQLAVSDTGTGMTPEVMSRVFEPFFTTKGPGKGTGLGLSTVYGIVRQSGGLIEIESEPGVGSTFRVILPVTEDRVPTPGLHSPESTLAGTGTILVVEDEEMIRHLAVRWLSKAGYRVIDAATPADALRVAADPELTIDLLLSDVVMPEMSGTELAGRLLPTRPGMRVLYMSGFPDHPCFPSGQVQEGTPLLRKPFTSEPLLRRVREALVG
ncbi:MAG: PAS domain S-box protein [Candidatus Riflebacteria bacterium]|nr:PAS domain S-box protein [Candidatus Riflebacteria bacterium]